MIISASYRTDIPAFYADWFLDRLAAGWVEVRNPYGGRVSRVSLRPEDVSGYVFWTRNLKPFFPALQAVADQGRPFVVQFTATGYPRALEPAVIGAEEATRQIRRVRDAYGPEAAVWRYDPILFTDVMTSAWHRENFARLAGRLQGAVTEVAVSVAQIYAKTRRGLDAAASRHGFAWRDPEAEEKRALLADLAAIAADRGLAFSLCAQPDLLTDGVAPARCIDAGRLSAIAQTDLAVREKGNRPGCLCAMARDIGAYDSCPHGCVYCYAVRNKNKAARFAKDFDTAAAGL